MIDLKLQFNEAVDLLKLAVKEKGADYSYEGEKDKNGNRCLYFNEQTGAPSCIVGYVLAYKGVGLDDVDLDNGSSVADLELSEDPYTTGLLDSVQTYQDQGMSWGAALSTALKNVEVYKHEDEMYPADGLEDDEGDDY